jgi:hypothetical protein
MGRGVDIPWIGVDPYPWYIDRLPMVYRNSYSWYIDTQPMVYRPHYPWYFDHPTHGISTNLAMTFGHFEFYSTQQKYVYVCEKITSHPQMK